MSSPIIGDCEELLSAVTKVSDIPADLKAHVHPRCIARPELQKEKKNFT